MTAAKTHLIDCSVAAAARRIALAHILPAVEAFPFATKLSQAQGGGSWRSLREPALLAAAQAGEVGLAALAAVGAFDGSTSLSANTEWGGLELPGGPTLNIGEGRARKELMPCVSRVTPWEEYETLWPSIQDPRFSNHLLAFATTTLFRRKGAALLAKRAAKSLLIDWIDLQIPLALTGRGPLVGLGSLAERDVLGQIAPEADSPRPPARRL